MEPGGNVLVLLLYRDAGELGLDHGVNVLPLLLYSYHPFNAVLREYAILLYMLES